MDVPDLAEGGCQGNVRAKIITQANWIFSNSLLVQDAKTLLPPTQLKRNMPNWLTMALTWLLVMSSICGSSLTREVEYSDWYLLKLSPFEEEEVNNSTKVKMEEPANLSSALLTSLATKLSVSPKVFKVNQFTLEHSGTISANLSVRWKGLAPSTHSRLASLQLTSPTFPLTGTSSRPYTLALLLHARKQHLYLPSPPSFNPHSLGLLLSLLLGGLGVFLLLLAASFLLVLVLGGTRDQQEEHLDEEELIEEELDAEEELEREYGSDRKMTMMLHQISRFYQRMICPQETMITLK